MSDQPICKSRRDAVKVMLGAAVAVPLVNLVGIGSARAAVPANAVAEDDPTAVALKYHQDAAKSERVAAARPGLPPEQQHCANCQFMQPEIAEGDEWRGCQLFPGKLINLNGWCASWTLRAA